MVNPTPATICSGCTQPFDPKEEVETLYECGNCSNVFGKSSGEGNGNRCTDCGKFAAASGQTHEGCNESVEDATPGFQCGQCGDATESEKEATTCCVEEPDPEPKPGEEPRAPKWTPDPTVAYIILRDGYMESRGRDDEPRYLDAAQKSKAFSVKNWTFRWNSLHWHNHPGLTFYWHDGTGGAMHVSDRATVDEKGVIHAKRVVGWKGWNTSKGLDEYEMLLKPVTQEELRVWKKGHEDRKRQKVEKERKRELQRRAKT